MTSTVEGIKVIDADTHFSEPEDLWTSRAPEKFKDRVPQVREIDGVRTWVFDGNAVGPALAAAVIDRNGVKVLGTKGLFEMTLEQAHAGASQVKPRLEYMDQAGIWAQIVYPNSVGFGGQLLAQVEDPALRLLTAQIWNDVMADMQEESGGRLCGSGLLPWWDVDECLKELERLDRRGIKSVMMNADPQTVGLPDLSEPHWDVLWDAISSVGMPVNFHIGASAQQMSYYGTAPWPSLSPDLKLALGSSMLYLGNARIVSNFIYGGVLERHPTLKVVSVESGIGWIPFILEALDYQLGEAGPEAFEHLSMKPSDYFRRQMYGCFWFEANNLTSTIEAVGVDNCLFETDFPHPTSLYPNAVERVSAALSDASEVMRRKVLSDNAARLYSIDVA